MPWTRRIRDVGVEINRAAGLVDYRGAGNPKRTDVSASECRPDDWLAERPGPDRVAGRCVKSMDIVLLRGDQQHPGVRPRFAPMKWLGINIAGDACLEFFIHVQRFCSLPG